MEPETAFNSRALDYYRRLRHVREHLCRHMSGSLTVDRAARIAGLSSSYFSTYFRTHVGIRFGDWLRFMRIERAKKLLQSGDHAIAEVAALVGYRQVRTLERAFKRETGISPMAYKHRVRPRHVADFRLNPGRDSTT